MAAPKYTLCSKNYHSTLSAAFATMRIAEELVDVTLRCDGQSLKAHRLILAGCSPYFREVFKSNPCRHHILNMQNVAWIDLLAIVEFIYYGVVTVGDTELQSFLRAADMFRIHAVLEVPACDILQEPQSQEPINNPLNHSQHQPTSNTHPTELNVVKSEEIQIYEMIVTNDDGESDERPPQTSTSLLDNAVQRECQDPVNQIADLTGMATPVVHTEGLQVLPAVNRNPNGFYGANICKVNKETSGRNSLPYRRPPGKNVECPHCHKFYKNKNSLNSHIYVFHKARKFI